MRHRSDYGQKSIYHRVEGTAPRQRWLPDSGLFENRADRAHSAPGASSDRDARFRRISELRYPVVRFPPRSLLPPSMRLYWLTLPYPWYVPHDRKAPERLRVSRDAI